MRANLEELRYTTVAPSRYTVYVSQAEFTRLEGILPRLQSETIRALNDELTRVSRRGPVRHAWRRLRRRLSPPLENADAQWHVEFLPDLDGDLRNEQDVIVHSELVLPAAPELGAGERTRRVSTMASERSERTAAAGPQASAHARLTYEDRAGAHQYEIVLDSTTIGRGGARYPVNVRVTTSDDVSREHARIRRAADSGEFFLIDLSIHGTTLDGRPVPRGYGDDGAGRRENGVETILPKRARIGLADTIFMDFERVS